MVKKCGVTFLVGFILTVVSIVSIVVLDATGYLDEDDLQIDLHGSSEEYAETTFAGTAFPNDDGGAYSYMEIPAEEAEQIKSLDISVGMGKLYIGIGDIFSLSGDNINSKNVTYEITDGCLKLNCASNFNILNFDLSSMDAPDVFLTVPAKVYDSVKVKISAGEFIADCIETNDLSFDISMGEATFYNVYAGKSAEISMSMGECYFYGADLQNAVIKMSAGDMDFENTKLHGNNNIKLTAGELYMMLWGSRSDYNFNIDKTAGEVIINGEDMEEFSEMTAVETSETVTLTQTLVTAEGDTEYTVTEKTEEASAEKGGTINIDLSAGECAIDFYGYENDDDCQVQDKHNQEMHH